MKRMVSIRLDVETIERLQKAAASGPYAPSMTKIIERGIELALRELERKQDKRGN